MNKNQLIYLLILIAVVAVSCQNHGRNQKFEENVDNAFVAFMYLLSIAFFGVPSLAFGLAYHKRKRDKDTLLVVSAVLLAFFLLSTSSAFRAYSFDLSEHPFVMGEFIIGIVLIGFAISQIILGIRRKKGGFNVIESNPKVTKNKKDIDPDQEIY